MAREGAQDWTAVLDGGSNKLWLSTTAAARGQICSFKVSRRRRLGQWARGWRAATVVVDCSSDAKEELGAAELEARA
ncbi:hypothetical protein M0R45_026354 [Rubus argutus]|uniref:Uncharacterized protein n=1 Tax=Rubus argutus TaxID=59490 RepID=A0AAW1WZW7_RUBAR